MSGSGNSVVSLGFILTLAVELPLLAFHVSVLGCIVRQQRKGNAAFRSGFFVIYAIQSVADYVGYCLAVVFNRLATMGYISQGTLDFPQGNIASFLLTYASTVEFMAHAAIALNRFFVLTESWNHRKLRAVLIAMLLLPLPHAAFRFVGACKLVETKVPGVYAVVRQIGNEQVPWVNTILSASVASYSAATALVSVIFELRSLVVYKRLTSAERRKYRNDLLLLVYALLQFGIQLAIIVCFGLSTYGALVGDIQLASFAISVNKYLGFGLVFSPPVCLMSMSKLLRRAYVEMYSPVVGLVNPGSSSIGSLPVASHARSTATVVLKVR